jgi:hypothetical protein
MVGGDLELSTVVTSTRRLSRLDELWRLSFSAISSSLFCCFVVSITFIRSLRRNDHSNAGLEESQSPLSMFIVDDVVLSFDDCLLFFSFFFVLLDDDGSFLSLPFSSQKN